MPRMNASSAAANAARAWPRNSAARRRPHPHRCRATTQPRQRHCLSADSYFYYLTEFREPQALLVLTSEGHSTLFARPKTWSVKSGTATAWAPRLHPPP
ncbi:MAG: aminopeptidase P N-terminal domain-containing protein [Paenacidovorax caeni]